MEVHPSTPVGKKGIRLSVPSGTNISTEIGQRQYSGHALDRMQQQGFTPSIVENVIKSGQLKTGKVPSTMAYYDSVNNITVLLDSSTGRVITVDYGMIKQ